MSKLVGGIIVGFFLFVTILAVATEFSGKARNEAYDRSFYSQLWNSQTVMMQREEGGILGIIVVKYPRYRSFDFAEPYRLRLEDGQIKVALADLAELEPMVMDLAREVKGRYYVLASIDGVPQVGKTFFGREIQTSGMIEIVVEASASPAGDWNEDGNLEYSADITRVFRVTREMPWPDARKGLDSPCEEIAALLVAVVEEVTSRHVNGYHW